MLQVLALHGTRSFQGCAVIQCWACLVSAAGKKLKSFPPFPAELIRIWSTSFTNMLLKYLKGWRLTCTEGAIFLVIWGWQTRFQGRETNRVPRVSHHGKRFGKCSNQSFIKHHRGFEPAAPHQSIDLLLALQHLVETVTSCFQQSQGHLSPSPDVLEHTEKRSQMQSADEPFFTFRKGELERTQRFINTNASVTFWDWWKWRELQASAWLKKHNERFASARLDIDRSLNDWNYTKGNGVMENTMDKTKVYWSQLYLSCNIS